MDKNFESKHTMMEASSDPAKSLVMLNRKIVWKDNGNAYIPDKRHCERVVEALNLQHARTVVTPAERAKALMVRAHENARWESVRTPDSQSEEASTHDALDADKTSLYRSAVAGLNCWAVDRSDTQCAVSVCAPSPCRAQESMTGRDSNEWQYT